MDTSCSVEHHAALIGLTGKYLEELFKDYGEDIFINCVTKYARQRGRRMQQRAIRDGRTLDYETFLAYSELSFETLPDDYEIQSEEPVLIKCCNRCRWDIGWKMFGLSKYGETYCKYIDMNLVQGFNPDMVMVTKSMLGLGDSQCRFVYVGYKQTTESLKRIQKMKEENGIKYYKDFIFHMGDWLSATKKVVIKATDERQYQILDRKLKEAFSKLFDHDLVERVWIAKEQDYELY